MEEFEALWLNSLLDARERAKSKGEEALVEYLDLKIRNERIRFEAGKLLFESFIKITQEKIADGYELETHIESPHRFLSGQAVLTGHLLSISFGIRKLTVKFGWTRKPEEGFMRKGALALAEIIHFGRPEYNVQLLLLPLPNREVGWFLIEKNGNLTKFQDFRKHVEVLIA